MAILETLIFIKDKPLQNHNEIHIYSDSKSVLQYISIETYPKYQNIKVIIEAILKLLIIINHKQPNLMIYFQKVKSHTNIAGNNFIDKKVNS